MDAAKEIESSGKKARVVSAVCWELFEDQDESYRNSILPPDVTARVCCRPPLLSLCACPQCMCRTCGLIHHVLLTITASTPAYQPSLVSRAEEFLPIVQHHHHRLRMGCL